MYVVFMTYSTRVQLRTSDSTSVICQITMIETLRPARVTASVLAFIPASSLIILSCIFNQNILTVEFQKTD